MNKMIHSILLGLAKFTVGVLNVNTWYLTKTQVNKTEISNKLEMQKTLLNQQAQELSTNNVGSVYGIRFLHGTSIYLNDKVEMLKPIEQDQKKFESLKDNYDLEMINKSISTFVKNGKELTDSIASKHSDISSNTLNFQVSNNAELNTNINFIDTSESNIFGSILDIIDNLNKNLSGLTLEQHACFVNTIALLIIFSAMNVITAIFYGDKIIKSLKLEERFPKLKKWIEYRRTFQSYFLIYNFILIYVVIFFLLLLIYLCFLCK